MMHRHSEDSTFHSATAPAQSVVGLRQHRVRQYGRGTLTAKEVKEKRYADLISALGMRNQVQPSVANHEDQPAQRNCVELTRFPRNDEPYHKERQKPDMEE